jgi:hypothetical protein
VIATIISIGSAKGLTRQQGPSLFNYSISLPQSTWFLLPVTSSLAYSKAKNAKASKEIKNPSEALIT